MKDRTIEMLAQGTYRGWWIGVQEPWEGMSVFFVVGPGPDPKMVWGIRRSFDEAVTSGRKVIVEEAKNEQSSRGRS